MQMTMMKNRFDLSRFFLYFGCRFHMCSAGDLQIHAGKVIV